MVQMVHMCLQTSDMLHVVATCVCTLLQDRAYAVWQRMVKAGVVPDEVTQRILVHCFSNNLQMASALVKEARQMRVRCMAVTAISLRTYAQCRSHTARGVPLAQQSMSHINAWRAYCIHPWTDMLRSSSQRLSCNSFCQK